jgi:hypothetical protein
MQIDASVTIRLEETVSFHESDRFFRYIRKQVETIDSVNITRFDDLNYSLSFENRVDMKKFVYKLFNDQKLMPTEFTDIEHLKYQIDMTVHDMDDTFVFYNEKSLTNAIEIIASALDEQTSRTDNIIEFLNSHNLGTYTQFRSLVLDTLVNHNMIKKTVSAIDKTHYH